MLIQGVWFRLQMTMQFVLKKGLFLQFQKLVNQAANDAEFSPSSERQQDLTHQRISKVFPLTSENFYIGSCFYEWVKWSELLY